MAEKLFYSMGEVAEMFDVKRSLIRHWESQFSILKPHRTARGNRMFTPQDVEHLKVIYHLVKERGMTLDGAKRALKQRGTGGAGLEREAELMARLKHIRALLVEVREDLKSGGEGIIADEEPAAAPEPAAAAPGRRRRKPVVKFEPAEDAAEEPVAEAAPAAPAEEVPAEVATAEAPVGPLSETSSESAAGMLSGTPVGNSAENPTESPAAAGGSKPRPAASRRPRRKSGDDDDKELFAFYEQSLF